MLPGMMQAGFFGAGAGLPTSITWALVEARDCSASPAANQDFANLGGYDELILIMDGVTASGASNRKLRLSVDNGATFYSASGDYGAINSNGSSPDHTELFGTNVSGTAAQYGVTHIPNLTGYLKKALSSVLSAASGSEQRFFRGSSERVNALRLTTGTSDTLNGGTIYLYGRTNPWTEAGSWSGSPAASNVDFTGLSGYDELLLTYDGVTSSASANRRIRYSVDNGSSFLSGGTDYRREHTVAGARTNWTEAQLNSVDGSTAKTMVHHLFNSKGACKLGLSIGGREDNSNYDPGHAFLASSSQVDALRVTTGVAATLNGGTIKVYGRAKPWTLIEARNCASSAAINQDFLNLDDYEELLFYMEGVGASGAASRDLHGSCDNGSTWETTSGDYYTNLTEGGAKTSGGAFASLSATSSAARYMLCYFPFIRGALKPCISTSNHLYSYMVSNGSPMNALRLASNSAFTLNSGTIYLYGR